MAEQHADTEEIDFDILSKDFDTILQNLENDPKTKEEIESICSEVRTFLKRFS